MQDGEIARGGVSVRKCGYWADVDDGAQRMVCSALK
jgi:hypothetical protein